LSAWTVLYKSARGASMPRPQCRRKRVPHCRATPFAAPDYTPLNQL
jgi:hypothetical protein